MNTDSRLADLQNKEVINITSGERLGYIYDAMFSPDTGKITAFIIPGKSKGLGLFGREEDIFIPWDCVRRVSNDIVLVETEKREKKL